MADNKRPRAPRFMSFKGTFKFPKVNEPDYKFKKEGEFSLKLVGREDDPAVKALIAQLEPLHQDAVVRGDEAFKKLAVKARKDFEQKGVKGAVVNPLYGVVYDNDTEEPTGEIEFKFSLPASGIVKNGKNAGKAWVRRPGIADETGKTVVPGIDFQFVGPDEDKDELLAKKGPNVWGGTVGKVRFEVGLGLDDQPGYFVPGTAAAGLSLKLIAVQYIELVSAGERDYGFGNEAGEDGEAEATTSDSTDGDF